MGRKLTGEVFDTNIFCPLCYSAPGLEIQARPEGDFSGVCPVCLAKYTIKAHQNKYNLEISLPVDRLIGGTGIAILNNMVTSELSDKNLDRETRRQLHKLENLRLVRVAVRKKKACWMITTNGLNFFMGDNKNV